MAPLTFLQQDADEGEMASPNRWMVSYADFITLLFVLFLVLYIRLPKHHEAGPPPALPAPAPVHRLPEIRPQPARMQARIPVQPPAPEPHALSHKLAQALGDLLRAEDLSLAVRPEGVLLEIRDTALFASGTAQPAEQAAAILARISGVLGEGGNAVVVEGHTDSIPIRTAQYPSNWELSSARAAAVVRMLQERGIGSGRLTAAGLSDTRPRSPNDTAQGRSENRRVSLLVLNDPKSGD